MKNNRYPYIEVTYILKITIRARRVLPCVQFGVDRELPGQTPVIAKLFCEQQRVWSKDTAWYKPKIYIYGDFSWCNQFPSTQSNACRRWVCNYTLFPRFDRTNIHSGHFTNLFISTFRKPIRYIYITKLLSATIINKLSNLLWHFIVL